MATVASARARWLRVAPRKLRLVADQIRGKKVAQARDILRFTVKGGAPVLGKVLAAAVANAESKAAETRQRIDTDDFVVRSVQVDGGPTARRFQAAPRGRAVRVRKRSSHVTMIISD
ncbi:MAG: 50S ribosomal protein L22 [Candidatus Hydrogenedentes bacterium]|nr:50S ribosomal protein L22 [Candidatus Hydrogenedentota bacterium]